MALDYRRYYLLPMLSFFLLPTLYYLHIIAKTDIPALCRLRIMIYSSENTSGVNRLLHIRCVKKTGQSRFSIWPVLYCWKWFLRTVFPSLKVCPGSSPSIAQLQCWSVRRRSLFFRFLRIENLQACSDVPVFPDRYKNCIDVSGLSPCSLWFHSLSDILFVSVIIIQQNAVI